MWTCLDLGMNCESGGLTVAGGGNNLGSYCGHRYSWDIITNSSELTLSLSDIPWTVGTHRITVEYEAIST